MIAAALSVKSHPKNPAPGHKEELIKVGAVPATRIISDVHASR